MVATAKKKVNVKAAKKSGSVNRTRTKPMTSADVEAVVNRVIDERSLITKVRASSSNVLANVVEGLQNIGNAVWEFCGKVYTTARAALVAMYNYLGALAQTAVGQAKTAYTKLRDLVGSMNMETISTGTIQLIAAACAIGLGITIGAATGVTMAGLATGLGASVGFSKVVGVLFAATTTCCVGEVVYAFSLAGLSDDYLATALLEARAQQAKPVVTVNAVKVAPVGA